LKLGPYFTAQLVFNEYIEDEFGPVNNIKKSLTNLKRFDFGFSEVLEFNISEESFMGWRSK